MSFGCKQDPISIIGLDATGLRANYAHHPVDGRSCGKEFHDQLSVEKFGLGYRVRLHSTQANQNICSFSFEMTERDGSLVRQTLYGEIVVKQVRDFLYFSTKGIDPTASGLGVCGAHADIDGLQFPLSRKWKADQCSWGGAGQ